MKTEGAPRPEAPGPALTQRLGKTLWLTLTPKAVFLAAGGKLEKRRCEMKLPGAKQNPRRFQAHMQTAGASDSCRCPADKVAAYSTAHSQIKAGSWLTSLWKFPFLNSFAFSAGFAAPLGPAGHLGKGTEAKE